MNENMGYHKGDVKQNAVNIAFAIVQGEGGKKLTMRHLADEIGISHTALYRHYKNKDAVLLQVATKGFKQLMLRMAACLKVPDKASAEQLSDASLAYVEFAMQHAEIYRLMNGGFVQNDAANVELSALSNQMFEILKIIILKGQAEGAFKKDNVDTMGFALWSMLHGYVELILRGRERDDAEAAVRFLISAVKV
ncbi:MAG: TetR/AcrR family transcriptional regulator [Alphaproteobacteria bacterium]|nr:TetR/AcrR family transcriptional regulator [Alphaproteobacteria bacterium]